jgi:ABC-type nitrate/sulfonate/bicarbonate transport system permease component
MSEPQQQPDPPPTTPAGPPASTPAPASGPAQAKQLEQVVGAPWLQLRRDIHPLAAIALSALGVALTFALWWYVTSGATGEERIVSPASLSSPQETFRTFPSLWFDRALTRNTLVTLRRVSAGFALACLVGVPLGVLAGCFPGVRALITPHVIFGRNIPIYALVGLTFVFFGIGETHKVMFIFLACIAFVIADTTSSIMDVEQQYVDTAYTLGASRWQTVIKVLVPLAMPSVFNSMRLLFGLAFGYVMLAELVREPGSVGGLGNLINTSMRQGPREHVYLIVLIIPVVALAIDRILYMIQRSLFPHRFGGAGLLNHAVRGTLHGWDALKGMVWRKRRTVGAPVPAKRNSTP